MQTPGLASGSEGRVGARQFERAEETLRKGLELHPNHPDLFAALGSVYFRSRPSRVTDTRAAWGRAFELGAKDWKLFLQWAQLEEQQNEWQTMLDAATRGLDRAGQGNPALLQLALAASRLGQSLQNSFNADRAAQQFSKSDEFVEAAIREGRAQGIERRFISRSYLAWVINAQASGDDGEVCRRLRAWLDWDGADPTALEEAQRQRRRCPQLSRYLDTAAAA